MPPKKKGANAGKKDAAVDKDKERLRLAQSEIVHLQQHIEIQKQDLLRARQMQKFWQQRCEESLADFEREKRKLLDIAQDVARKSTVQSDQKQLTIEGLEGKLKDIELENSALQRKLETVEGENAVAATAHAKEAKELRQQIQCMHGECSKLISTTIQAFKTDLLTPYIREAHLQVGTGFVTPKQAIDSLQTQC